MIFFHISINHSKEQYLTFWNILPYQVYFVQNQLKQKDQQEKFWWESF